MGCGAILGMVRGGDDSTVILDEADEDGEQDETVPPYWTNKKHTDKSLFSQMVYVNSSHHRKFDDLMRASYEAKSTKDRPCPKETDKCDRQSQGCPCVRVDGTPGLPTAFVVRRVVRVEHSRMWSNFAEKRKKITENRKGQKLHRFHPPTMTADTTKAHEDVFGRCYGSINEVYLWHGTHVRTALSIAAKDFNMDLAGTGRGAMYGPGAYFAECCTKADEYAFDEPGGYYDGIRAMLLCRVTMGKMYYTTKFGEEAAYEKVKSGECDSTLADLAKHRKTFREFVVYDADQVYPEYVVLYQRVFKADNLSKIREIAATPYHLELPVYWMNCHRVPQNEAFDEQCRLRRTTVELLQRLVDASIGNKVERAEIQSALRIENTKLLNEYVSFKAVVRKHLQGDVLQPALTYSGKCLSASRLSGGGDVLTASYLKTEGDFAEESISVDNLEQTLNEHLLWYGATQEEVRAMSHHGLDVARAGNNLDFSRFGPGLYFSEHLQQALHFAETDDEGIKHVLLCRVCCGEIFYTEEESLPDGEDQAKSKRKHSILANPSRCGSREFIVFESAQVYPEFVLNMRVESNGDE